MTDLPRLPRRFPVGTRYVLEGVPAKGRLRVISRLLLLPDGRQFDLTEDSAAGQPRRRARRASDRRRRLKR